MASESHKHPLQQGEGNKDTGDDTLGADKSDSDGTARGQKSSHPEMTELDKRGQSRGTESNKSNNGKNVNAVSGRGNDKIQKEQIQANPCHSNPEKRKHDSTAENHTGTVTGPETKSSTTPKSYSAVVSGNMNQGSHSSQPTKQQATKQVNKHVIIFK